jgi:hypothetical protein
MSQDFHCRIDLRGALRNWRASDWKNCVRDDAGKMMTPEEVRDQFFDYLSSGKKFIPCGPCDNFDEERGCLGHPHEPAERQ